jgi:hypothetical protein
MNDEELVKNLIKEIERLKAVHAIQNCMGHYETLHFCGTEVGRTGKECFALWRDDVTVEVSTDEGVFGSKAVDEYWSRATMIEGSGNLVFMHTLATPIIEVAGNGKTAKAVWCSPGLEAGITPDGGDLNLWCWGKYGMDFIKNPETGEWRIWHMKWFRITRNDYDKNFTEYASIEDDRIRNPKPRTSMADNLPTFPLVFHQPFSVDPSKQSHPFPYTPKSYHDYDGDFRWIYGSVEREKLFGVKYNGNEKYYNKNYPERI